MGQETIFVPSNKDAKAQMAKWRLINGKGKENIKARYETKPGGTLIVITYGKS